MDIGNVLFERVPLRENNRGHGTDMEWELTYIHHRLSLLPLNVSSEFITFTLSNDFSTSSFLLDTDSEQADITFITVPYVTISTSCLAHKIIVPSPPIGHENN